MKANKAVMIMVLFILTALTGCYPTGEIQTENNQNESAEMNADDIENLTFDIEENSDYLSAYPCIDVSLKKWDEDVLKSLFMTSGEISEQYTYESDISPGKEQKVYVLNDKSMLNYEDGNLSFSLRDENKQKNYGYFAKESFFEVTDETIKNRYTDEELDFEEKSEAIKNADDIIHKLGIENLGEPLVYAMSADKINEITSEENTLNKDGTPFEGWSKSDEAYVILYNHSFNGLNVGRYSVPVHETQYNGSYVMLVISSEGLVYMDANMIYEKASYKENSNIISMNTAAKKMLNKYSSIVLLNPVTVSGGRLDYVIASRNDEIFTLSPVWNFTVTERITEINADFISAKLINAYTGEILEGE